MEEIMLSILVPTYNHEKYIVQALESIRMQETKYSYEVLVGEDLSTDNTRNVLKEYENKYPGFATIFYRDHNMNNEPIRNARDLRNRSHGKYIITLEGDDFWTDSKKIEKQISYLENHPDYIAVAHRCVVVDEKSKVSKEVFPSCEDDDYTLRHYASEIMPGQTTTVMYRNIKEGGSVDVSLYNETIQPGDRRLFFTLVSNGKVHCIQEEMSAYRHITNSGSSFSATNKYSHEQILLWYRKQLQYAYKIENLNAINVAEMMYAAEVRRIWLRKYISFKDARREFRLIKNRKNALMLLLKRDLNRFVLKKKIVI